MSDSNSPLPRLARRLSLLLVLLASCGGDDPDPTSSRVDAAADASRTDVIVGAADGPADAPPRADGPGPADAPVPTAECAKKACSGAVADLCCPASCTASTDIDCGGCGNGRLEPGETCDPLQSCPTTCPSLNCQKQRLKSEGTCSAVCVSAGEETECKSGDGCCPSGCTGANDLDCGVKCGNGALEAGETCDPLATCPQSCPALGCTLRKLEGAGTCGARCVPAGEQTMCTSGDGCCPAGCTRDNDDDCATTCGNGMLEGKETCDPVASCPTAATCKSEGCKLRKLLNPGTCSAVCADDGVQTMCQNGDGCCPAGCHRNNDADCTATCGNGQLETGETCDPVGSCLDKQAACVSDGNVARTREGNPETCTFQCRETPRACGPKDNGCPAGCTAGQDPDCAGCGNGIKEANESCDPCNPADVAACVTDDNAIRTPSGDPAACTFVCTTAPRMCAGGDNLCPMGCTPAQDPDCRLPAGAVCAIDVECQSTKCVDSRCCVQSCGNCQSCTGPGGTCANIAQGQEDQNPPQACSGGATCNGMGACVLPNGSPCSLNVQCGSGTCKDGYCCNQTCTGACRSCSQPGLLGTCAVILSAEDPDTCSAETSKTCDANGACVATACTVTPTPGKHDYGSVNVGTASTAQTFSFRNNCSTAIGPFAVSVSGADAAQFTIGQNSCNGSLAPGASCTVTVTFNPTTAGTKNATLTAASTFASASASLAGTGAGAKLSFKPTSLAFGVVTVGNVSDQRITLVNDGPAATGVPQVGISPVVRLPHFTIVSNGCTASVPVGGVCTISVRFGPRTTGPLTATLQVTTPAGSASAPLSGTGQQPPLLLTPSSFSFGSIFLGSRQTTTFTLQNTSGQVLGGPQISVDAAGAIGAPAAEFGATHDCTGIEFWQPGSTCTITMIFAPSTSGAKSTALRASAGLPGGGTGTAASPVTGTGQPRLTVSPVGPVSPTVVQPIREGTVAP